MNLSRTLLLFLCVFTLSGFSGLIYESIWSHYLKLFLGHAAYAQALVLINFMGGMALGAWLASKFSHRIPNLFIAYAIIEAIIGLFGLGFHLLFNYILAFSYDTVFVSLEPKILVHTYKWSIATLLILPQSLLLGMTFPLMSNGLIRLLPYAPGHCIATLYFCNSIGAAIGVLVSGFYLIGKVGLPGTIMMAGILNILLAIAVYFIVKPLGIGNLQPSMARHNSEKKVSTGNWRNLFLIAALVTGIASFIYEIAWIRMLAMVLGSSTHAFELMLSAFITGLALGGLWIRKRLDRFKNPLQIAGGVQIAMGLLALATIPLYNYTFDLMNFFINSFRGNESGYLLFNLSSHLIALLVMLPTTFCAGMTLPLFSLLLIKHGYGERSIGHVYASNTLGAIIGVVFAVFIGMPWLGLKGAMLVGASLDILLGGILLVSVIGLKGVKLRSPAIIATIASLVLLLGIGSTVNFDVKRMASAVYRNGLATLDSEISVLMHLDGPTASISVIDQGEGISIHTNGKPDALVVMDEAKPPASDEYTMVMLAALPLSIHPSARAIANIGFGSGMTTHTLLLSNTVETVDTIEIEPAMITGAKFFQEKNNLAFSDPRSRINIEDAKTYFHSNNKKYDMIISEPSNPWVSGVSSLFTSEFYQTIKHYLNDDGIFAQWLQIYESDIQIVLPILKAISVNFSDYQIYKTDTGNLLIIASPEKVLSLPNATIFSDLAMREQLSRINVRNMHDLSIRLLGNKKIFEPYLQLNRIVSNSDFFPVVDLLATKARFISQPVYELNDIRRYPVPIIQQLLATDMDVHQQHQITPSKGLATSHHVREAQEIYHFAMGVPLEDSQIPNLLNINFLLNLAQHCQADANSEMWIEALFDLHIKTVAYLYSGHITEISQRIESTCGRDVPEMATDLMALYAAYGERDMVAIAEHSRKLLGNGLDKNFQQEEFLSASLLLNLVTLDRYWEATQVWEETIKKLYPDEEHMPFALQILGSMLVSKGSDVRH